MICLGSWKAEWCWLQSPPLSCYMTGVLEIFLQRPTIALLLHRISHVTHCVYILTKAFLLFTLLLKIAYVELKVGKWKHALVSHLLQNQTTDPWRWQITQADQDRAHMWKVDGGNGMKYSFYESLSPLFGYHEDMAIYISFSSLSFFCGHWCVQFFWVMLLGHAILFLIAHASFERYQRERDH